MSNFLKDIEAAIQNIHVAHGVDNAEVTSQVTNAVNTAVAPLQTQVTDLQGQVSELQKTLQDTVTAINNGDIAAAQATASAAATAINSSTGSESGQAGTPQANNNTAAGN